LKRVLSDLTGGHEFDDRSVNRYYVTLASFIGVWSSERRDPEAKSIEKKILEIADNLRDASASLAGLETGLRTDIETAASSRILNLMALDPTIGSKDAARELLETFRRNAERIAQFCGEAVAGLPTGPDRRGRKVHEWYDSFTKLLLDVAEKAGKRPTLHRHLDDTPKGWRLDSAGQIETFLPREMRSPSDEARYKRLERSKNRLRAG
jgi:hypothetical protein